MFWPQLFLPVMMIGLFNCFTAGPDWTLVWNIPWFSFICADLYGAGRQLAAARTTRLEQSATFQRHLRLTERAQVIHTQILLFPFFPQKHLNVFVQTAAVWGTDAAIAAKLAEVWKLGGQTCLTENLSQVAFIRTKHISGVIYLVLIRIVMNFGILIIPSASWVSLINDHVGHVTWQLLGTKWACPCCRAQMQSCVIEVIAICWCPSAPPNVTWVQQLKYFTDEPEEPDEL